MKIHDGHVHTPFCPHGTNDDFALYLEQAIRLGYSGLTFTEHAPLPHGFVDPTPTKDSGMSYDFIFNYINNLKALKKEYQNYLEIKIGFEVDYIEGYEEETKHFLNEVGPYLDDSILSVHFLKRQNQYYCLDYSLDEFGNIIHHFDNSLNGVYQGYLNTLLLSIQSDLGTYKPRRLGHITLPTKFQKVYPLPSLLKEEFLLLLGKIKEQNLTLDYNGAGVNKTYGGDPYPPEWLVNVAYKMEIPIIYGSDAHQAKDLGQGLQQLSQHVRLTSP